MLNYLNLFYIVPPKGWIVHGGGAARSKHAKSAHAWHKRMSNRKDRRDSKALTRECLEDMEFEMSDDVVECETWAEPVSTFSHVTTQKLFIVHLIGSYAMEVQVHRAASKEELERTLGPMGHEDYLWRHRTITEVSEKGFSGKVFEAHYIE